MAGQWRAFPLVYASCSDSNVTLQVSSDARDALLSVCTKNIGILGVFGPPASETRLLLRTLLQSQDVDISTASESRKDVLLWLYISQDQVQENTDKICVVLAAGASLEAEEIENQKLALMLLLSSVLLYNTEGEINAESVEKLQWVEKVSRVLRVKEMQDEDAVASEFSYHAPKFIWLARNFKIKWLKDAEGQKLTPMQYFEQHLAPEKGYGEAATYRNMLRMYMESYFPVRDCVTLSRAMEGNGTESVAPETNRSELRAQFVEAVDNLYEDYLSSNEQHLSSKKLMDYELRSDQFIKVLDAYVDAMNARQLPSMQKVLNTLLEQEVAETFAMAKQKYDAEMLGITGFRKEDNDRKACSVRDLHLAHFRGIEAAMTCIREVRSRLPGRMQATLFKDKLCEWEARTKGDFQATLERNATLSTELCFEVFKRVLPRNLEVMATLLGETPREQFSDGLIRLLTQYKSDLRSAADEYAEQGNGPAVDTCLEEALLKPISASIQKWSTIILRQYKAHLRSWKTEKEQLESAYELAKVHETDTIASANDQKRSREAQLAQATEQLCEVRRALHRELNNKKSELEGLTTELSTMVLRHNVRVKNAESDLAWARSRTEELEKSVTASCQRKEEKLAAAKQVMEKQRSFRQEERSLLVQQKEMLVQLVQLERELVQKRTNHAQKVYELQNEHAKTLASIRLQQAKSQRQLKSQAKKEICLLRRAHEANKKTIFAQNAGLDKEMAEIREKLAVYEAEEEIARAAATASRNFFKSMPMMSLPLMQAPVATIRQSTKRSSETSMVKEFTAPARFSSLDDTSTSSASPTARA
ncbi:unnamed protein product [Peronospora effusa]|nr:unnamed protein product [Peronospora effusa]